jgi:hypothetical protein
MAWDVTESLCVVASSANCIMSIVAVRPTRSLNAEDSLLFTNSISHYFADQFICWLRFVLSFVFFISISF